jgi:putative tryptophan/tyrosine transport system substrate-binding protein
MGAGEPGMIPRRVVMLGIVAVPLAARAQPAGRLPLVGVLLPHHLNPDFPVFLSRLRELGHEDGRTIRLEIKSADTQLERLPQLAAELVAMRPHVIVAANTPPARAAVNATKEIPIVLAHVGDPLGQGFVRNLSRPGGNVTGSSNLVSDLAAKRLQILKEIVPNARRIAVLFNPDDPNTTPQRRQVERAASQVGVDLRFFPVRDEAGVVAAFAEVASWPADALQCLSGQEPAFIAAAIRIAVERRLPLMVPQPWQVPIGGLIAYAPDPAASYRHAAVYVDKILKGARPGDLPVEQPTEVALSINVKTARALGLKLPPALLARADDIFE